MRVALILCIAAAASLPAAEPLTLARALDEARNQSPAIQLARLQALETELGLARVRSAYLPQASFTLSTAYRTSNLQGIGLVFPGFSSRLGPYRVFDARPVVTQTIFDGSLLAHIRAARERARLAGEEAAGVREALLYSVIQFYLQALEAGARVEAGQARLRTAEAVHKQTQDRKDAGTASQLDVERAAQQVHEETAAVERTRGERDVLKTMLAKLIAAPDAEFDLAGIALPASAVPAAAPDRPEVRALESRLRVDDHEMEAIRRERWPKLTGVADWGVLGAGPDQAIGTYNLGVSVTFPLWTGRRIESDLAAARLRRQQTEQRLREVRLEIAQEVRQSEVESASTRRALDASARAAGAARETLALVRLRFEAGLATSLDTTVAQGALAQAEEEEIRARYQHLLARARSAHAQGDSAAFLNGL